MLRRGSLAATRCGDLGVEDGESIPRVSGIPIPVPEEAFDGFTENGTRLARQALIQGFEDDGNSRGFPCALENIHGAGDGRLGLLLAHLGFESLLGVPAQSLEALPPKRCACERGLQITAKVFH